VHEVLLDQEGESEHVEIESPHGHDGFLIESDAVSAILGDFLARVEKDGGQGR